MLKNSRSVSVDLRRRKSFMNLEHFNPQSLALIGMIVMILIISVLCVAAYPNSNMFTGI
jgi:competence protein ComGC